jgi:hypothetical protein
MTGSLEFPYRLRGTVVFGLLALFAVCLACLAGLAYAIYAGTLPWMGWGRGPVSMVIVAAVCVVLIPFYLITTRGSVRLTDSEMKAIWLALPPSPCVETLPIREIQTIEVQQVGKFRVMNLRASGGYSATIQESMLPSSQAFDQLHQALLSSRTGWRQTGMTWSVKQ